MCLFLLQVSNGELDELHCEDDGSCVCFCCRFPMVSWTNCTVKMMVHVFVSAAGFQW